MTNFNIEGGLKLSLMSGLLDLQGSAEYLTGNTDNANVASVSLIYNQTTVTRDLTQNAFKEIDYPELLQDNDVFTHVVVAIQYGGKCIMLCEKELTETEEKSKVGVMLKAMIRPVPVGGEFKAENAFEEERTKKDITCKVLSDISLDEVVDDLDSAAKLYKSLPTKLKKERGVPVWVWLMPKSNLPCHTVRCADIMRNEISEHLVSNTITIIENLSAMINRSSVLIKLAHEIPSVKEKITTFQSYLESYLIKFQNEILKKLIVDIRSGKTEEKALSKILKKLPNSPFGKLKLEKWLDSVNKELNLLQTYRKCGDNKYTNIDLQQSTEYEKSRITTKSCAVLTIRISGKKDKYLESLKHFLNHEGIVQMLSDDQSITDDEYACDPKSWYNDEALLDEMRQKIISFSDFAIANKNNVDCKFIVRSVSYLKDDKPSISIDIYQKGSLSIPNFDLNSIYTEINTVTMSDTFIKLSLEDDVSLENGGINKDPTDSVRDNGKHDNFVYILTFKKDQLATDGDAESATKEHMVTKKEWEDRYYFVASNLQSQTKYTFTVYKKYLGIDLNGCESTRTINTYMIGKPKNVHLRLHSYRYVDISWVMPSLTNVQVYDVRLVEQPNKSYQYCQIDTISCMIIIDWLRFNQKYSITIRACRDGEAISDWSDEYLIATHPVPIPVVSSYVLVDGKLNITLTNPLPKKILDAEGNFIVRCKLIRENENWNTITMTGTNVLLTADVDFPARGWYDIQLQLSTRYGCSEWSTTGKVKHQMKQVNLTLFCFGVYYCFIKVDFHSNHFHARS